MSTNTAMAWVVSQVRSAGPVRIDPPPPSAWAWEKSFMHEVLCHIRVTGPSSVLMLAQRLGMTSPREYERVRNAVNRLAAKQLIARHSIDRGRGPQWNRVIWHVSPPRREHQAKS